MSDDAPQWSFSYLAAQQEQHALLEAERIKKERRRLQNAQAQARCSARRKRALDSLLMQNSASSGCFQTGPTGAPAAVNQVCAMPPGHTPTPPWGGERVPAPPRSADELEDFVLKLEEHVKFLSSMVHRLHGQVIALEANFHSAAPTAAVMAIQPAAPEPASGEFFVCLRRRSFL